MIISSISSSYRTNSIKYVTRGPLLVSPYSGESIGKPLNPKPLNPKEMEYRGVGPIGLTGPFNIQGAPPNLTPHSVYNMGLDSPNRGVWTRKVLTNRMKTHN